MRAATVPAPASSGRGEEATFDAAGLRRRLDRLPLPWRTPALAANLLDVAVIVGAFWASAPRAFLLAWALSVGLAALHGLRAWTLARRRPPCEAASPCH